jgi:hypothetical protein
MYSDKTALQTHYITKHKKQIKRDPNQSVTYIPRYVRVDRQIFTCNKHEVDIHT